MALTGFNTVAVRPRGGVRWAELLPANKFTGSFGASSGAAHYEFCEDRAHYEETQVGGALRVLVRHTFVMELPAGRDARRVVDEIRDAGGLAARIRTMADEEITVGNNYPLRLTNLELVSGTAPSDYPTVKITLECTDYE